MQEIFGGVLPIFLITMLGSVIKHKWLTSEEFWRGLEKLLYFLLFPVMLFYNIVTADLTSGELIRLIIGLMLSSGVVGLGLILYKRRYDIDASQFTSIFQGSIRYNTYIFLALGASLYGSQGMKIIAVVAAYMIIFTNAVSILIFTTYIPDPTLKESGGARLIHLVRKFGVNPLIVASLIGFIFNYAGVEFNFGIQKTLQSLSDSALAIGVMNVGAGLKFSVDEKDFKQLSVTCIVKLLIFPLVSMVILSMMSITGMPKAIGILYSGLPCATTSYILAKQLGGDPDLMASIITATTILCVFSLPLFIYILT